MSRTRTKVVLNGCYGGFGFNDLGEKIFSDLGYPEPSILPRHHPVLVRVVEELGNKIAGMCADLYVQTIKGNEYRISEYDGAETIVVPGQTNYIKVDSSEVKLTKEQSDAIVDIVDPILMGAESDDDNY